MSSSCLHLRTFSSPGGGLWGVVGTKAENSSSSPPADPLCSLWSLSCSSALAQTTGSGSAAFWDRFPAFVRKRPSSGRGPETPRFGSFAQQQAKTLSTSSFLTP